MVPFSICVKLLGKHCVSSKGKVRLRLPVKPVDVRAQEVPTAACVLHMALIPEN